MSFTRLYVSPVCLPLPRVGTNRGRTQTKVSSRRRDGSEVGSEWVVVSSQSLGPVSVPIRVS